MEKKREILLLWERVNMLADRLKQVEDLLERSLDAAGDLREPLPERSLFETFRL